MFSSFLFYIICGVLQVLTTKMRLKMRLVRLSYLTNMQTNNEQATCEFSLAISTKLLGISFQIMAYSVFFSDHII